MPTLLEVLSLPSNLMLSSLPFPYLPQSPKDSFFKVAEKLFFSPSLFTGAIIVQTVVPTMKKKIQRYPVSCFFLSLDQSDVFIRHQ